MNDRSPAVQLSDFCRFLHSSRVARGMSLAGLADAAGVTRQMVSMVERGNRRATDALAIKLARALDEDPRRVVALATRARLAKHSDLKDFADAEGALSTFDAARLHYARGCDYEVPLFSVTSYINRHGDMRIVRQFSGLRPIPGGPPLRTLRFQERAAGHSQRPKLREIEQSVSYQVHTETVGDYHLHRMTFDKPWQIGSAEEADDGITFEFETKHRRAIKTDDGIGAVVFYVTHPICRLRFSLEFTTDAPLPTDWIGCAAWLGGGQFEDDRRNFIDHCCRSWTHERTERGLRIEVHEPLMFTSFAIPWRSSDDWPTEVSGP